MDVQRAVGECETLKDAVHANDARNCVVAWKEKRNVSYNLLIIGG